MNHPISSLIDHTLLRPEASRSDIVKCCSEALQYGFFSVCVQPYWVKTASNVLQGTDVKVTTVIGFPLGMVTTETKVFETQQAIEHGATELDMVVSLGLFKSGEYQAVQKDIQAVVQAAQGLTVKVILEIGLLNEQEIVLLCQLAQEAGADFVKTSTGFGPGGATVAAVKLMRKTVGKDLGVKASGGIRDLATAQAMLDAGADRLGTSHSVSILHSSEW